MVRYFGNGGIVLEMGRVENTSWPVSATRLKSRRPRRESGERELSPEGIAHDGS